MYRNENDKWRERYLQKDYRTAGYGNYQVEEVISVNILLVGRTQTGKSTIINSLIDPNHVSSQTSYSGTEKPELRKLIVTKKTESGHKSYQLNMIDTPGLKEIRNLKGKTKDDSELLKFSKLFITENIARLNMVAMVTRAGDTHHQDITVFRDLIKFLGEEMSEISMLILTHCDAYSDDQISKFEQAIMTHQDTKDIYKYCKLKLWRVGALNKDAIDAFQDEELGKNFAKNRLHKNAEFREKFLTQIFELAGEGMHIKKLNSVKEDNEKQIELARKEGYNQAKMEIKIKESGPYIVYAVIVMIIAVILYFALKK